METHGVHAGVIPVTPTKAELAPSKPIFTAATGAFVVQWIPYFLVGLVYVATTYVRWKKVGWHCELSGGEGEGCWAGRTR